MRVQVASCERYRLRVTTWGPFAIGGPSPRGSGAAPHAVVLPGISADWRGLAPQSRTPRPVGGSVPVIDLPRFAPRPPPPPPDPHAAHPPASVRRAARRR